MRLGLENFMSHDLSTVDLPSTGLVVVTGRNGAGKSALAEAIAQCMWGRSLRGARWSPWRPGVKGQVIITDTGTPPQEFVVRRGWTGKSKSLKVDHGSGEHDTTTKAQEDLDSIVGTFEAWRRTRVFSSSDAAHFTLASDAERKELLEQLLGLSWFERALEQCRKDLNTALSSVQIEETAKMNADAKASGLRSGLDDARKLLSDFVIPSIGTARAEIARTEEMRLESTRELRTLEARIAELRTTGGSDDERARQARARLAKIAEDECPTCRQQIPAALRQALRDDEQAAVKAAEAAREAVAEELRKLTRDSRELAEERDELARIVGKRKAEIEAAERAQLQHDKLSKIVTGSDEQIAEMVSRITSAEERLALLRVDVAELRACEEVLGVRGARAHLLGETLSMVEVAANLWLSRLDSEINISLKPYTERKSGSVVDAISLALVGAGGEGGYLGASAGERRRVDVAILMALASLASGQQQGAMWRSPIFFDEVFDSLDASGRESVVELVTGLAERECVVMITHDDAVANARATMRLRVDGGSIMCE